MNWIVMGVTLTIFIIIGGFLIHWSLAAEKHFNLEDS